MSGRAEEIDFKKVEKVIPLNVKGNEEMMTGEVKIKTLNTWRIM